MIFKNNYSKFLSPTDLVVILFFSLLTVLNIIFSSKIEYWAVIIVFNILLILLILLLAKKAGLSKHAFWVNLHYYYVIPLIFITFKEIYVIISSIHSVDYDSLLISADHFIFGLNPTVFLYQFANPILTEILQIAYGTFFFLPIILAIEFHRTKEYDKFHFIIFSVVLGFFLSYLGYLIFPAVGPRFTLHDFDMTNIELPGLFLTNFLREIVNAGESIPSGTINPIAVVQRDVFPSGHTQMTLIVMYLSVKLKSKNKLFFLIDGTLLIIATVYLRYHYVVDLIGGLVFMILTMFIGKKLFNWWQLRNNKPTFEYKS